MRDEIIEKMNELGYQLGSEAKENGYHVMVFLKSNTPAEIIVQIEESKGVDDG